MTPVPRCVPLFALLLLTACGGLSTVSEEADLRFLFRDDVAAFRIGVSRQGVFVDELATVGAPDLLMTPAIWQAEEGAEPVDSCEAAAAPFGVVASTWTSGGQTEELSAEEMDGAGAEALLVSADHWFPSYDCFDDRCAGDGVLGVSRDASAPACVAADLKVQVRLSSPVSVTDGPAGLTVFVGELESGGS